jgi:hypothetical protein
MDTSTSVIYQQLIVFQSDLSQHRLVFDNPSPTNQAYIQTLTRGLGLDFEYSTDTKSAKVTRPLSNHPQLFFPTFEVESVDIADVEQSSPFQPNGEVVIPHDPPPLAEAEWRDYINSLDWDDLRSNLDPILSSESAYPELNIPGKSIELSHQSVFLDSPDIDPALNTAISITNQSIEQDPSAAFTSDMSGREPSIFTAPTFKEGIIGSPRKTRPMFYIEYPFSREGSMQEANHPAFEVWDSKSANSASSSIGSAASAMSIGRRGPRSSTARAMANAFKAVKACLRCKFMRKSVSLIPPL